MPNINKITNSAGREHTGRGKAFLCRRVTPTYRSECKPRCAPVQTSRSSELVKIFPNCQTSGSKYESQSWLNNKRASLVFALVGEFEARNKPQGFPPARNVLTRKKCKVWNARPGEEDINATQVLGVPTCTPSACLLRRCAVSLLDLTLYHTLPLPWVHQNRTYPANMWLAFSNAVQGVQGDTRSF